MYNVIIFDLDDTLTNDEENIKEAFKEVMKHRKETYDDNKFSKFYKIDKKTWKERAEGKLITPYEDDNEKKAEWLRAYRFLEYYNNEITYNEAVEINSIYMEGMKKNVVPREYALDIMKYLYEKNYKIVIVTNGPTIPLKTKIEKLGTSSYVSNVFSAEEIGAMKPHKIFYEGLFKKANIIKSDKILFIGDELEKDIKGGIENGMDTCWCNYNGDKNRKYNINYEIHSLKELENIL